MKPCTHCAKPHDGLFALCIDCIDAIQSQHRSTEEKTAKQQRHAAKSAEWQHLCPLDYRKTDWTDPRLSPICAELAKTWWPAWDQEERGLGIVGTTGLGKTRAAYAILQRLHFAGIPVLAIDSISFARAASNYHDDDKIEKSSARDLLRRAQTTKVLLLDDIGKEPATPRAASALHELLELRNRNHLPLIWTTERSGDDLAPMFGTNYADGIIRRLRGNHQIANLNTNPA